MENKSVLKREIILRSAIRVIARRGYFNTRIADIIEDAKIAHGLVYHYFKSKDEVILSIFRDAWNIFLSHTMRISRENEDPLAALEKIVEYVFRVFQRNPDIIKVLIFDVPRIDDFYSKANQKLYHSFFEKIMAIIAAGQEKGLIRNTVEPVIAAYTIIGAVDSIIRQYVYNEDFTNMLAMDKAEQQIKMIILEGLKT